MSRWRVAVVLGFGFYLVAMAYMAGRVITAHP